MATTEVVSDVVVVAAAAAPYVDVTVAAARSPDHSLYVHRRTLFERALFLLLPLLALV